MSVAERLRERGLELPEPPKALGLYVPAIRTGNLLYTAGSLPMRDGRLVATGKVPDDVPIEQAAGAARQAALNMLAAALTQIESLDAVARVVRLNVFVNSSAGFTDQAKVANGASELINQLFGEAGRHTRCAIGVSDLPANAPVEIDMVAELRT